MPTPSKKPTDSAYAVNRRARHDYDILETFQVGVVLTGGETKSIRNGRASLLEAFARFDRRGELWLVNCHIGEYQSDPKNVKAIVTTARRKLLLHNEEIIKLTRELKAKGLTLIPLKLYNAHNRVKLDLGLCRGKKLFDKRDDLKKKDIERDTKRMMKTQRIKM